MPFSSAKRLRAGVVAVTLLAGCSNARSGPTAAPGFELKDLSGQTVTLESFRGHPVFLDFWATWCGPCRMSIPMVQKFYQQHKAEGLVVLGMNVDDDPHDVYAFVKHFGMTYPVLLAGNSATQGDYQVEGIPNFVFIDQNGKIADHFEGFSMEMPAVWEADLKTLLAQKKTQ